MTVSPQSLLGSPSSSCKGPKQTKAELLQRLSLAACPDQCIGYPILPEVATTPLQPASSSCCRPLSAGYSPKSSRHLQVTQANQLDSTVYTARPSKYPRLPILLHIAKYIRLDTGASKQRVRKTVIGFLPTYSIYWFRDRLAEV
jgi:hypothetical protein